MTRRPRLLVVGESQRPTGYSRVAEGILGGLAAEWEIHQFEVPGGDRQVDRPWRVHRAPPGRVDRHGVEGVPALVSDLRPDLVLFLHEIVTVGFHRGLAGQVPTVAYIPLEGPDAAPFALAHAGWVDHWVVFHEAARLDLPEPWRSRASVIPHGVDLPVSPITRDEARQRLWPELADAFIVLNLNRPNPRKRIDLTVEGFAEFARTRPDTHLVLHAGPNPGIIVPSATMSEETLALVYRACDVGVNTACAEGWGLVAFEHGATGAPQIMPRHPGLAEIWEDDAIFLNVKTTPNERFTLGLIDPSHLADALTRLYEDRDHRDAFAARALARANRPHLRWPEIARRWDAHLRTILGHRHAA